jgi:hypothetical protein
MILKPAAALTVLALSVLAAGCGSSSSASSTPSTVTTTPSTAGQAAGAGARRTLPAAFVACLKQHGVTLPTGGFRRPSGGGGFPGAPGANGAPPTTNRPAETPAQAKRRTAFAACSKFAPQGGFGFGRGGRGGFAAYTACMRKQGVTFGRGAKVNLASPKFKAAAKKCKSLLPAAGAGGASPGNGQ